MRRLLTPPQYAPCRPSDASPRAQCVTSPSRRVRCRCVQNGWQHYGAGPQACNSSPPSTLARNQHDGGVTQRDRDEDGRARNARPRDELGRPLPPGSPGIERIPDDFALPPEQTLRYAQELLDNGRAFTAHEVLEAAWKNGPTAERQLWQGLAQIAVAITHVQRGNIKGAITLLERGTANIGTEPAGYGIDSAGLRSYTATLITQLRTGNQPDSLRPRLYHDE